MDRGMRIRVHRAWVAGQCGELSLTLTRRESQALQAGKEGVTAHQLGTRKYLQVHQCKDDPECPVVQLPRRHYLLQMKLMRAAAAVLVEPEHHGRVKTNSRAASPIIRLLETLPAFIPHIRVAGSRLMM